MTTLTSNLAVKAHLMQPLLYFAFFLHTSDIDLNLLF